MGKGHDQVGNSAVEGVFEKLVRCCKALGESRENFSITTVGGLRSDFASRIESLQQLE